MRAPRLISFAVEIASLSVFSHPRVEQDQDVVATSARRPRIDVLPFRHGGVENSTALARCGRPPFAGSPQRAAGKWRERSVLGIGAVFGEVPDGAQDPEGARLGGMTRQSLVAALYLLPRDRRQGSLRPCGERLQASSVIVDGGRLVVVALAASMSSSACCSVVTATFSRLAAATGPRRPQRRRAS